MKVFKKLGTICFLFRLGQTEGFELVGGLQRVSGAESGVMGTNQCLAS